MKQFLNEFCFRPNQTFEICEIRVSINRSRLKGGVFFIQISPSTQYFYGRIAERVGIKATQWHLLGDFDSFLYIDSIICFSTLEDANNLANILIWLSSGEEKHKHKAIRINDYYERRALGIEDACRRC